MTNITCGTICNQLAQHFENQGKTTYLIIKDRITNRSQKIPWDKRANKNDPVSIFFWMKRP